MSYYNVDNNVKGLKVWNQYQRNQVVVDYFSFVKDFYQKNYFDEAMTIFQNELSIEGANSEYIIFLAKWLYNIDIPYLYISNIARYDNGYIYDDGVKYDVYTVSRLSLSYFKRLCKAILNYNKRLFNLQSFIEQVAYLSNIKPTDVYLTLSTNNPYHVKLNLPLILNTAIYKELIINYKSVFNFPAFFDIVEISFREVQQP